MNAEEYRRLIDEFTDSRDTLHADRNSRYAHDDDVLANIKRTATGSLTPLQVWMVYAAKHWDSICGLVDAISRGDTPDPLIGEADIAGSFRDLANYIELGYALLHELPLTDDQASQKINDDCTQRLREAYYALHEDGDGENLAGPFCGCETCIVREVIDAAMPTIRKHIG